MSAKVAQSVQLNPHISIDCVVFGFDEDELKVLLIERKPVASRESAGSFQTKLALPGNLIRDDEDLDTNARRILQELTGLAHIYLQQFGSFGDPDRVRGENDIAWLKEMRKEPMERVVTIAYYSLVKLSDYEPHASLFAEKAEWYPVSRIKSLAFDHYKILNGALETLKNDVRIHPVGFELLPGKFTLGQLQRLYEIILSTELDKRNFRRKILKTGILKPSGEKQSGVRHKPAELFSFDKKRYYELREERYDIGL